MEMNMKTHTKVLIILSLGLPIFLLIGKGANAVLNLPTIITVCEFKDGSIRSINDGFSLLKKCPNGSRLALITGEPGLKGDKGDPGDPAPSLPPVEEIMVFEYGDLNGGVEPKVIDLEGHRVFTINCLVDQGDGGVKTWSSEDQENWNLEYRDGCGGVAQRYYQNTAKVKARYYKIVLEGSFKGYVSVLAN